MHAYKEGVRDRSVRIEPSTGNKFARLQCTHCNFTGSITLRTLMPPDQIDKKFQQRGWNLDPAECPTCNKKLSKARKAAILNEPLMLMPTPEPTPMDDDVDGIVVAVSSNGEVLSFPLHLEFETEPEPEPKPKHTPKPKLKPAYRHNHYHEKKEQEEPMDSNVLRMVSADTHKAAAKMHMLLVSHFDPETGHFEQGWTDLRIAQETGLSEIHVAEVRTVAYGELKVPDEIVALKNDIKALNDLLMETMASAQKEVTALNERITMLGKGLGFKV